VPEDVLDRSVIAASFRGREKKCCAEGIEVGLPGSREEGKLRSVSWRGPSRLIDASGGYF